MPWPQQEAFQSRKNYFLACLSELAGPVLKLWARLSVPNPPASPGQWRKGLLLGANHIGDVLYRSASLPALTENLPHCTWDWAIPRPAAEAILNNPHVRKIHDFEIFKSLSPENLAALKAENYDVAICYDTGKIQSALKLALDLGIPNRVAFSHKGFNAWITHPVPIRFPQPYPGYFRDQVAALIHKPPSWPLRPLVYPTPQNETDAAGKWSELGLDAAPRVLAVFLTSRQPSGVWPISSFLECIRQILSADPAIAVVFCGSAQDEKVLQQAARDLGSPSSILCGSLDLPALVCFLKKCSVVLSTDSGPRHLSNAAGTPVVFIRNPWFYAAEAGPYAETDHDMAPDYQSVQDPVELNAIFSKIDSAPIAREVIKILQEPSGA